MGIAILLTGCATVNAPDGGPEDVRPPHVTEMYPANSTTLFNSQRIEMKFDEFIKLANPSRQILISPPISPKPSYQVKGKRLVIDLPDSLAANTTYSIYFAKAIQDFTVGNDTSFSYVFSTGSQIDSLKQSAYVRDAFTHKGVPDVWVLGYYADRDSLVDLKQPDFVAKTMQTGFATLTYLPNKPLRIFALKDDNFSLIYDSPEEQIGFSERTFLPTEDSVIAQLNLFTAEDTSILLKDKSYGHPGQLRFVFNKPLPADETLPADGLTGDQSTKDANDTLFYYIPEDKVVRGTYQIPLSLKGEADTATFYIGEKLKEASKPLEVSGGFTVLHDRPIRIKAFRPIKAIDPSGITLMQDSVQIKATFEIDDSDAHYMQIKADLKPQTSYRLFIPSGAITSYYSVSNDTLSATLTTHREDFLGALKLTVTHPKPILVELTLENRIVHREIASGALNIPRLRPGKYKARAIVDLDQNGEWTTGDYSIRRQPERVYHFEEDIEIRSGWDVDLEWIIPEE